MLILDFIPIILLITGLIRLRYSSSSFKAIFNLTSIVSTKFLLRNFIGAIVYSFSSQILFDHAFTFWGIYVLLGLVYITYILFMIKKLQVEIKQSILLENGLQSIENSHRYKNKLVHTKASKNHSFEVIYSLKWDVAIFSLLLVFLILLNTTN